MIKTKEGKSIFIVNKGFTAVPNELILDNDISNSAKFLYIIISSLGGLDIKHEYQKVHIQARARYGRDKLANALSELVKSNWLTREKVNLNNKGNMYYYIYKLVYEKE